MLSIASASSLAAYERVTTTSGNITFKAPTYPVTTTITPVANLTSGQVAGSTKIAEIGFSSPQPQKIAYRWGAATSNFTPPANRIMIATIKGNNNSTNQLQLVLGINTDASAQSNGDGTNWMVTKNEVTSFKSDINTVGVSSSVNPDTYTVHIESGVYVL
ncbi:hypothetical protein [Enterobacter roggenkampii]|uniref:hypothetical protein n=1 Tax=Enterobacter roggenkampii TaxID=1812935 RepID=UPI002A8358AA|nr:hypothetical protein [Enterobacter roggenkampii]